MNYKCPECGKELFWITDNKDDDHIIIEYRCEECDIDVIKNKYINKVNTSPMYIKSNMEPNKSVEVWGSGTSILKFK
jgi:DNA-directed RNA polymerase subunit RPC12/RpoP